MSDEPEPVAVDPICGHRWQDSSSVSRVDLGHDDWHQCMRSPGHERMHICQCGAVASP